MTSGSLDPRWVRTWAAAVDAHVRTVLSTFDAYYPFPPGANELVPAVPRQSSLDDLRARPAIPPDLVTFYEVIREVTLPDIGNGIFIHAADAALADDPVLLDEAGTGLIFASNGGGVRYAVDSGNRVHRCADSGFEPAAADLRDFLGQVLDAVAQFAATGSPGDI